MDYDGSAIAHAASRNMWECCVICNVWFQKFGGYKFSFYEIKE